MSQFPRLMALTSSGNPYFHYSALVGDDKILSHSELSGTKKWIFHNPTRIRFTYDVQIISGGSPADNKYAPLLFGITNPVNHSVTTTSTPYITIEFTDYDSGINLSSLAIQVNGTARELNKVRQMGLRKRLCGKEEIGTRVRGILFELGPHFLFLGPRHGAKPIKCGPSCIPEGR